MSFSFFIKMNRSGSLPNISHFCPTSSSSTDVSTQNKDIHRKSLLNLHENKQDTNNHDNNCNDTNNMNVYQKNHQTDDEINCWDVNEKRMINNNNNNNSPTILNGQLKEELDIEDDEQDIELVRQSMLQVILTSNTNDSNDVALLSDDMDDIYSNHSTISEIDIKLLNKQKSFNDHLNNIRKRSVSINLPIQRISKIEQQTEETLYNSYTEMNSVFRQSHKNHTLDDVTNKNDDTNDNLNHPEDITSSSGQLRNFLSRLDNVSNGCTTNTTKDEIRMMDEKNTDDEITEELEDDDDHDHGVHDITTEVNIKQNHKKTLNNECQESFIDICKSVHGSRLARVTEVNESDFEISEDVDDDDEDDDGSLSDDDNDTDSVLDDSSETDSFSDNSFISNVSKNSHKRKINNDIIHNNSIIKPTINNNQLGDTQFLRLEQMRADLEEELGFELLIKAYNVIQALQEDEDETITESEQIVTNVLGEEKTRIYYDRILQLVLADGAYMDDNNQKKNGHIVQTQMGITDIVEKIVRNNVNV
ncbi:unnamed protein product [Schistosoma margrebowiei]|uniref:Uncharacterized protein n=1 Tax=Schistosoma margrebowiei TaxID=48269 RepID=A0A183LCS2_9TREM|nr:unnamed protein product [Schistosoma margrebowiei]